MKKMIGSLALAAVAGFALLNYHFILFDDNLEILKKTGPRYQNTFIDARGTKKLDLLLKPDLIAAGIHDVIRQIDRKVHQQTGH